MDINCAKPYGTGIDDSFVDGTPIVCTPIGLMYAANHAITELVCCILLESPGTTKLLLAHTSFCAIWVQLLNEACVGERLTAKSPQRLLYIGENIPGYFHNVDNSRILDIRQDIFYFVRSSNDA